MANEKIVKLSELISSNFYSMAKMVQNNEYLFYLLKGGRNSSKGSFAYIMTILILTIDAEKGIDTHAVALRKVKETIRTSCFVNLLWAIDLLGLNDIWDSTVSPMRIWHKKNDNSILFRGCANQKDYEKIKSIKFKKGYCRIAIWEELTEFAGMEEIDNIIQSLFRGEGSDDCFGFMMYNPPASKSNWTNEYSDELEKLQRQGKRNDTFIHHSTYLELPRKWVGEKFIQKAEIVKENNPKAYEHIYLGKCTGEGLEIYNNLEIRTITDEEIAIECDTVRRGLDFGNTHATCYMETSYNMKKDWIYLLDEVYLYGASQKTMYERIYPKAGRLLIIGDSASPNIIRELNDLGLYVIGAKKGPDSKTFGIKWVSDRTKIIIDKKRTPEACHDFETYEYKKNKEGKIVYEYPEEPDGCLVGDTKVLTNNGWIDIKDLVGISGKLFSLNVETKEVELKQYYDCRKTGTNAKVFQVTTKSGKKFKCTASHPILTDKGYKLLKDLKVSNNIVAMYDKIKINTDEVVQIQEDSNEDVYNLTVRDNNNFFINGGLCVHNSASVRYSLESYILNNVIRFAGRR